MHRQRTTQTADHDEDLAELRLGHEHFRELVQDDEQGGQRRIPVFACQAVRLVIGHVRIVTRHAQHFLAAHHLALEGVLHTVDEGELRLQVRNHGRHVRQIRHTRESRATLKVDENQVQLLRRVGEGQGQHEGAQHLGLTRTGRADQQAVRTHTLLGGFLNIQDHGLTLRRHREGSGEARTPLAADPLLLRVEVADVADAHQLHEVLLARHIRAAHGFLGVLQTLLRRKGRHAPGDSLRLNRRQAVGAGRLGKRIHRHHVDDVPAVMFLPGADDEAQGRVRCHRRPLADPAHDGHAANPGRRAEG